MIYFTSDLHFGHNKEFLYGARGFDSIEEHDEAVIKNWNSVVEDGDTVYVLGDVTMVDLEHGEECLRRLHGQIKVIIGNHDSEHKLAMYKTLPNVEVIGYATMITVDKQNFYLCHYPTVIRDAISNYRLKENIITLFGHTHQKSRFYLTSPFMYNVALDAHDCTPVSIDEVLADVKLNVEMYKANVIGASNIF